MTKDSLSEYIRFNKNKEPEELTPQELEEVELAYQEYLETTSN